MMHCILAKAKSAANAPRAFRLEKRAIPVPGAGDLLVRVGAVGMNPIDTKVRQSMDQDATLGWDACGTVEAVGDTVQNFSVGDRVFYAGELMRPGCNSEYQLVDERLAAAAPESLPDAQAAAMPLTCITAWESLFDRLGFTPAPEANAGKTLLLIGGAGGVGSAAIQLAAWAGISVRATASRPETAAWCEQLGADTVINHHADLPDQLRDAGSPEVDAVFCTQHLESHWQAMARCVRPQGRVVMLNDPANPLDLQIFKRKSVAIAWEFMFTRALYRTPDMAEQGKLLAVVSELLDTGVMRSTCTQTLHGLTPENIRTMHQTQEKGSMIGKQTLTIAP